MTDWTWQDLEREAPEVAETLERHFRLYPHSLAAAIGRLVAQRDQRIKELEKDAARLNELERRLSDTYGFTDLLLSWDDEDGFWVSEIRRGDAYSAMILDEAEEPLTTLRAALDAVKAR